MDPQRNVRGINFTHEEDIMLVNGWLSTSLDAIVGNDQKSKTFWGRVHNYYHECKKPTHQERTEHSLMSRWSIVQRSVNKFCGCLAQIENLHPSGHSGDDKVKMAKVFYKENTKKVFLYEHCWDILRYQAKWIMHKNEKQAKNDIVTRDDPYTLETIDLDGETPKCERPLGRKSEKENMKKRKYREEKNALFEKVLSKLSEERKQFHDEKMAKMDMLAQIEEKRLAQKDRLLTIAEKRLDHEEMEKVHQFMIMDISGFDEVQQEYVQKRRLEIVQNMKAN